MINELVQLLPIKELVEVTVGIRYEEIDGWTNFSSYLVTDNIKSIALEFDDDF